MTAEAAAAPPGGETFYLIDGYAAIFRAYYAIRRPFYSPTTGEETQAVFVFARMLHKLYSTLAPDYLVVALDAPGETFRDELYRGYFESPPSEEKPADTPVPEVPGYKGTRRATPDGLSAQIPRILELLELLGIPMIGKAGLEADDVIATLTERVLAERPDLRVRIVSRDKDLEQLLRDGPDGRPAVTLFDVHSGAEFGRAELWEKRGVRPEQVPDLLALTGDAVDNVPGVPGIGGRTAAKLLQEFGSLDGVLQNLDRAPARLRPALEQARTAVLPLSRRLVTLHRDPEVAQAFDLEAARVPRPTPVRAASAAALCRFFEELGFESLSHQFQNL